MAKIDGSVKKKVPELRFKGFTDEWEQRKVSDVSDRYDNLRVPVAANLRIKGSTPYYGANGIQDYVEGYTHDGEFVLVAEDGANDLKNYPVNYVNGRVLGEKKTPEKIGCDCKIKKVPRKRHLYYNIYFWLFHNHF